jgi:poly(3-hydroxybutyrate) depolymerase
VHFLRFEIQIARFARLTPLEWPAVKAAQRVLVGLLLFVAAAVGLAEKAEVHRESLESGGKTRSYWLFVPDAAASSPRPLVVLLHGSGRNGETLARPWSDIARKEGIVLAAPDSGDSVHWSSPTDGPRLLRDVVDAVKAKTSIDLRRVYLYGHSAGAIFALLMGAYESEYFAAVAVHAGALHPDDYGALDWAARKIPIAIWIGDKDAFFPLDAVRATRDRLKSRGFPVEYVEIPGHTHDYYGSAASLNRGAWKFLSPHALTADPKYAAYGESK